MMQRDAEGEDLLRMTSAGHATNMVTGKNFYHTHQRERESRGFGFDENDDNRLTLLIPD